MCLSCWAGVIYLRYTVLSSTDQERAKQPPTVAILLVMGSCHVGVSKRFHVVSAALQFIVFRTRFANFFNQSGPIQAVCLLMFEI